MLLMLQYMYVVHSFYFYSIQYIMTNVITPDLI